MNIEELRTTSTIELVGLLSDACKVQNQSLVNIFAYELATRIYIPNEESSFIDMLYKFGYKRIKENKNVLSRK